MIRLMTTRGNPNDCLSLKTETVFFPEKTLSVDYCKSLQDDTKSSSEALSTPKIETVTFSTVLEF